MLSMTNKSVVKGLIAAGVFLINIAVGVVCCGSPAFHAASYILLIYTFLAIILPTIDQCRLQSDRGSALALICFKTGRFIQVSAAISMGLGLELIAWAIGCLASDVLMSMALAEQSSSIQLLPLRCCSIVFGTWILLVTAFVERVENKYPIIFALLVTGLDIGRYLHRFLFVAVAAWVYTRAESTYREAIPLESS